MGLEKFGPDLIVFCFSRHIYICMCVCIWIYLPSKIAFILIFLITSPPPPRLETIIEKRKKYWVLLRSALTCWQTGGPQRSRKRELNFFSLSCAKKKQSLENIHFRLRHHSHEKKTCKMTCTVPTTNTNNSITSCTTTTSTGTVPFCRLPLIRSIPSSLAFLVSKVTLKFQRRFCARYKNTHT